MKSFIFFPTTSKSVNWTSTLAHQRAMKWATPAIWAWVGTMVSFQETLPELNCVCFSLKPVVEPFALPSIFLARTLTHLAQNCKIAQLLKKLDLFLAFWRDGWGDRFSIIFEIIIIVTIIIINITVIFRKKLPPPFLSEPFTCTLLSQAGGLSLICPPGVK